jgi:hypothetical protein
MFLNRMGFTLEETVALIGGGHTMAFLARQNNPTDPDLADGPFDSTPEKFDNQWFKDLLDNPDSARIPADKHMMDDPDMKRIFERFANSDREFNDAFVTAMVKMADMGASFDDVTPPPPPPPPTSTRTTTTTTSEATTTTSSRTEPTTSTTTETSSSSEQSSSTTTTSKVETRETSTTATETSSAEATLTSSETSTTTTANTEPTETSSQDSSASITIDMSLLNALSVLFGLVYVL